MPGKSTGLPLDPIWTSRDSSTTCRITEPVSGAYMRAGPGRTELSFDGYYIGLDRKAATFNRGTAHELRHTLGVRIWRPAAKENGWDFDYEGVWQFGTFGADGIRAWTFAAETGTAFLRAAEAADQREGRYFERR